VRHVKRHPGFQGDNKAPDIKHFYRCGEDGERLIETAVIKLGFSARAYDRILKVARTIAGPAGEEEIRPSHISEAIQYRMMDRVR
jgi:magnesium chelatase family protein